MSDMMVPAVPAEPTEFPSEPAEPAWAGPSQDEWGQVTETLGSLAQFVQQQQAPPEVDEDGYAIDPFADNFGTQLQGFIRQALQTELAPVLEYQQAQQMSEAEERAIDILEDITSREGDFLSKDQAFEAARALANVYMVEEAEKRGYGPQAAEAALARAAAQVRAYEQAVAEAAVQRHMNQLQNLSGAGREPGATGAGAPQFTLSEGGDEMDLVRRYGGLGAA